MRAECAGPSATAPLPVLFLMADTGGGHRNAARAVGESLQLAYPGGFAPVLCDPLGGPGSARLLRWVTGLYGPAVRLAPWLWGAAYYATNVRPAMWLLRRTLLRLADRAAATAAMAHGPAAIVSFHPLTGAAGILVGLEQSPASSWCLPTPASSATGVTNGRPGAGSERRAGGLAGLLAAVGAV